MSVYIKGHRPGIRISKGRVMSVSMKTLRVLGCPKFIQFWYSPKGNALFIGAADEQTSLSFPVKERYYNSKSGFQLQNGSFIRAVQDFAEWGRCATCAVDGEYLDAIGMVAFPLNDTRMEDYDNE